MRSLRSSLVMVVVLVAAILVGCGKPETRVERGNREQVLHVGHGAEPQELDPHIVTGVTEHHVIMSLLEGLVTEDPKDLHPVPGVATNWTVSPDSTVYTFQLRHDAKWSNGDPVTAKDFLQSYRRILTPTLISEYAYMHYPVKNAEAYHKGSVTNFNEVGYKVVDDYTFEITLRYPTSYFLSLMNHTSWFPVHLPTVEKHGAPYQRGNKWTRAGNFVGNGPFVLETWNVNHVLVVKKSPTYWDRANTRLNAIHFYPTENNDAEERAFRSGQLHLTEMIPLPKIDVYRKEAPQLLTITPYLGSYFYRINITKPPLNDKRVRKALSMAVDRESLVKNVTKGGQIPAHHFTPPDTAGYSARARVPTDIEGARKLLAEAGFPGGKGLPPIEILYNTAEQHRMIAEAIQEMWRQNLGVDARLVNQEWKVYLDSQDVLNYQICRAGWIGDYVDPTSFLDMWLTGGGNNDTGFSNEKYDALIREAGKTLERDKRYELFQQAEAILLEELPFVPLYFYTRVRLFSPAVKGWYPTILDNHPYKYIYLEGAK